MSTTLQRLMRSLSLHIFVTRDIRQRIPHLGHVLTAPAANIRSNILDAELLKITYLASWPTEATYCNDSHQIDRAHNITYE